MPRQRWFAGKSHSPRLRILDAVDVVPGATTYFVMDDAGAHPTLYQVPLADGDDPDRAGVVGVVGGRVLVDAPTDHAFAVALLDRLGVPVDRVTSSAVMAGEQSNTSIVYAEDGEPTLIAKLFRTLHHGENPDVTLQGALSRAGSGSVPRFGGALTARWPDTGRAEGVAEGTLAFVQEFLPGARDGWSIAVEAARAARDFTPAARDLGVALADVHRTLADVLPTRPLDPGGVAVLAATWAARLDLAAAEVPAVADRRAAIEAVYAAAREVEWPPLQRVHGDLHLGQVLAVPSLGWRIVDFEGEPLRPMAERGEADVAIRDVAGMLRSFDYAAGVGLGDDPGWASACRGAFLDAYGAAGGVLGSVVLLEAFELDKAVYESVYEARNRPEWLPIPISGVDAILAR